MRASQRPSKAHGISACMTRSDHPTGTDRLAEAAAQMGLDDDAIVVNVQGDEPLLEPALIRSMAELLAAHPEPRSPPPVT
jgi:3-deoxy-manno-octulosonate cytidylyltransferase (CMP-KDO synthetase)